jgi:hypothetical protein
MSRSSDNKTPESTIQIITCHGKTDPLTLFQEYSFVGEDWKRDLFNYCLDRGFIAIIDRDPETGHWIFHSIQHPETNRVWKKNIADRFEQLYSRNSETEAEFEARFVAHLRAQGIMVERQVACIAGIADVVTDSTIYEIKLLLSKSELFRAIGQVLFYRQSLNPSAQAVVICKRSSVPYLHKIANGLGVAILEWNSDNEVT